MGVSVYKEEDEEGVCCALYGYATIFTAELVAIYLALKLIQDDNRKHKTNTNYIIATDSESSISALKNNDFQAHANPTYMISVGR